MTRSRLATLPRLKRQSTSTGNIFRLLLVPIGTLDQRHATAMATIATAASIRRTPNLAFPPWDRACCRLCKYRPRVTRLMGRPKGRRISRTALRARCGPCQASQPSSSRTRFLVSRTPAKCRSNSLARFLTYCARRLSADAARNSVAPSACSRFRSAMSSGDHGRDSGVRFGLSSKLTPKRQRLFPDLSTTDRAPVESQMRRRDSFGGTSS
jgi:hypothetical protein